MAGEVTVDLDKVAELEEAERKKLADAKGGDVAIVDAPKGDDPPPKKKPEDIQRGNEESVDDLKRRLDEATGRAVAAEGRAATAEQTAMAARGEVRKTQLQTIDDTISALTDKSGMLKARLIEAQAAQDWATAADIQEQFTTTTTDIANLRADKVRAESRPEVRGEPLRSGDPAEDLARFMVSNGAPKSAEWVRRHPEYARDPVKYQGMVGAHNVAIAKGLVPDTDTYFAHVEQLLGIGHSDAPPPRTDQNGGGNNGTGGGSADGGSMSGASQPTGGRQTQPAAAPPSRGAAANGTGSGSRTVTLTSEEADIARMNKQTPEEYWRNKQALIREGKIGKPN